MAFQSKEIASLRRIIGLAEKLIADSRNSHSRPNGAGKQDGEKRVRRSGKELAQFRKMLKAERKKGVPVAKLARQHRISTAYIYSL
jgi:hypothetical protein